ncbi:DUF6087 family protein [Streptomyces sp. NPDC058308]|uniref:DUF6087 family protein n=1 Tax=Streptomyces sp. NPDC058308 TaxID=3346440 RepID=UPI0036ED8C18
MHEAPLEGWARRREERRAASKGKLRAVPLTQGPHRGAYVDPYAPWGVQEWTGVPCETVGVVNDLAVAKALLHPSQPVESKPAHWGRPPGLGPGCGRHQKLA